MFERFRQILALPNDSREKTLLVALLLCLVCSIVVAATAVLLRPIQDANQALDRKRNIIEVAGLSDPAKTIDELFAHIETRIVDLQSGEYTDALDAAAYDFRKAAGDPELSTAVAAGQDIAGIKTRPDYMPVYLVKDTGDGTVKTIILPLHGYGLWSTLYGFLALESDADTVQGLKFYEHAETPGLGGEVDNPRWRGLWPGKKIFGADGEVRIEVVKGRVDAQSAGAEYRIDGLAGATLTSRGVGNMLRYWLSGQGYLPYLRRMRESTSGS